MRLHFLAPFILLVSGPACAAQAPGARPAEEARRPVRRHADSPSPVGGIQFTTFNFMSGYAGREGPGLHGADGEPSAGAEYLAEAELFGQESAATAKFELVDERGRPIQTLRFSKISTSLDDGEFYGLVTTPSHPFRVRVSGTDVSGAPYQSVYERLFRPTDRPPEPPLLPPDLPPSQHALILEALKEQERQAKAKLAAKSGQHPDGLIVLPRARVSNVTSEPYVSSGGNPLGIRLRYDIEYSADGDYEHSMQVFPDYKDAGMRGLVEMQVIRESVEPRPAPPSYATPSTHVDMETLVRYGSAARYRGGVVYHFVIDLVPDFVGENATKTKFCLDESHYQHKVKTPREWERMKALGEQVSYRILMRQVDYGGDTEPAPPPRTFYEGFLKEGAVRCLPHKNIHF